MITDAIDAYGCKNDELEINSINISNLNEELIVEKLITLGGKQPKYNQVVILGGGSGCFSADTLIKTESGYEFISKISKGQKIYTINEKTKEIELKHVNEILKHDGLEHPMLELEFDNGEKIQCTENHKFYVNGDWIQAKELTGDMEFGMEFGVKLIKKTKIERVNFVYDLSVNENHNYIVSESDVIVHNSGKGFVMDKILGITGKVFDVDATKKKVRDSKKLKATILKNYNVDVDKLSMKKSEDVDTLHRIIKRMGIDEQLQYLFMQSVKDSKNKTNIIFDSTLKSIQKLSNITSAVTEAGYKKENIHIVWVVNNIATAKKQNQDRDRTVPEDILVNTHRLVSETMSQLLKGEESNILKYMNGDFWVVFNDKTSDTILKTSGIDGKYKNIFKEGSYVSEVIYFKVKEQGKPIKNFDEISQKYIDKIKKYVPNAESW